MTGATNEKAANRQTMRPRAKYWIFLGVIALAVFAVILGSFFASWHHLSGEEQAYVWTLADKLLPFPVIGAVYLVLIIGGMVSLLFHYYIMPILKLSEEVKLISVVNPHHRIAPRGAKELVQLTDIINESAAAYEQLQQDVDLLVQNDKRQLKAERNRLAALMSELPSGVMVCNSDGQILLYNPQAQRMLQQPGRLIGLGRSLFNVMDRDPVIHALNILDQAVHQGQTTPVSSFIVTTPAQLCLRVSMAPLLSDREEDRDISGFVLSIEDMTRQFEADLQVDQLVQMLTETMQFSSGEIRDAISAILASPGMPQAELDSHRRTIDRASLAMEDQLRHVRDHYARYRGTRNRTDNVLGSDLVELLGKHMGERLGVQVATRAAADLWLSLDSFALTQGLTRLGDSLKQAGISDLEIALDPPRDDRTCLQLSWSGQTMTEQALDDWQHRPLLQDAQQRPLTFLGLVAQMGGTITCSAQQRDDRCRLSFMLPVSAPGPRRATAAGPEHRPIYYEFDLFRTTDLGELGKLPLNKLTCVVFDTETTGLNPSEGDEIIQIGAIRIVNGRILRDETMDQLVDPQRRVPAASVAIHGIDPSLLEGQPTIDQVLPIFHHFAEGSVLVAHNAAFDMKFLKIRENEAGVRFDHPVLDTLLLSSIVHPHQEQHSLEGIASLFDIPIVGRHTALGDAIVTAEVFVRLLPLLADKGILTLQQAIEASAESGFAKLKY